MGPSFAIFELWQGPNCLGSCLTGEDVAGYYKSRAGKMVQRVKAFTWKAELNLQTPHEDGRRESTAQSPLTSTFTPWHTAPQSPFSPSYTNIMEITMIDGDDDNLGKH